MVPVGKGNFLRSSHVTIDVGRMWRQEVSLQLVLQQHVVLRRKAEARSETKNKNFKPLIPSPSKYNTFVDCTVLVLSIPHDVFYAGPLAEEGVHNRCP